MIVLLLFWVMCAVASAAIAAGKGRSGAVWFLLGLVFGLFALVIVACLPGGSAGMKQCPECAESIQANARICRYCRHEFSNAEVAEARAPSLWQKLWWNPNA